MMKPYLYILVFLYLWSFSHIAYAQFMDARAVAEAGSYLDYLKTQVPEEEIDRISPITLLRACRLAGQLDRASMSPKDFVESIYYAEMVRNRFYPNISRVNFEKYILPFRIRFEHTRNLFYRKRFHQQFQDQLTDYETAKEAAHFLLTWISDHIEIEGEHTYPLNLKGDQDPWTTLLRRKGNEIDISIFAVALLRSCGIAARLAYAPVLKNQSGGKVWVEYHDGIETWHPWWPSFKHSNNTKERFLKKYGEHIIYVMACPEFPINITNHYSQTAQLQISPDPVNTAAFGYSLLVPLSHGVSNVLGRDIYSKIPQGNHAHLGSGDYIITTGTNPRGTRSRGVVAFYPIELKPGQQGWYTVTPNRKQQVFRISANRPNFFKADIPEFPRDSSW